MSSDPLKLKTPFFLPAHRRALTVGVCFLWSLFELSWNAPFWFVLFFALGLYLTYVFFFNFDPAEFQDNDDEESDR